MRAFFLPCRKLNLQFPTEGSGVKFVLDDIMQSDPQFAGMKPMVDQAYDMGR